MQLSTIDYVVFVGYCALILGIGLWVSRDKKGHQKNAEDYFLAGKSLPWWAIGASLIAANISAEQFIGMSGSGFAIGLARLLTRFNVRKPTVDWESGKVGLPDY
jgi:SSS family solute:Na+ symporter